MIVVDTSVWIDHLAHGIPGFENALDDTEILMHPFVIGELACGTLKDRATVMADMGNLLEPVLASHAEVITLIEKRQLMGRGIGYIDMHLLASTLLTDSARLWTNDRRLRKAAAELDIAYRLH